MMNGGRKGKEEFYPDSLMRFLPIPTLLDKCHDDVLCHHERKLLRYPLRNNHGIYNKTL
jgi:hypothetical protein